MYDYVWNVRKVIFICKCVVVFEIVCEIVMCNFDMFECMLCACRVFCTDSNFGR
jgi:hypothetical protein